MNQNILQNDISTKQIKQIANAIRYLSVCMVEKANSGHPGMPLGAADIVAVLFSKFLNFSTKNPKWQNRDRFILSAGHASAMLYSTLYLFGYGDISMDDLKNFRQLHSKTAGHPEYGYLDGIEVTTGPLGQGFANAVGMAIAAKKFNEELGAEISNNYTFALVGDGCLQEGISFEAAELAGHLKLSNLITIYDNNAITIDGKLDIALSSSTKQRFLAHGWNVLTCDGHNYSEIETSINEAKLSTDKPTIIICQTKIGFASVKEGSEESHGSPLKGIDVDNLAKNLEIDYPKFTVPQHIMLACKQATDRGNDKYNNWLQILQNSPKKALFDEYFNQKPSITNEQLKTLKQQYYAEKPSLATRNLSGNILSVMQQEFKNVVIGSADLAKSNCVLTKFSKAITPQNAAGNYIHYGIREHAMGAIMNGLFLYGGILPIGATFLVFSDYLRPSIRLSAIMNLGVIYVFTHDSIFVGEDGPTHQPVEHLPALRCIPNINLFRPCDAIETAECYQLALQNTTTPSIFALSRQGIKMLRNVNNESNNLSSMGAYIIYSSNNINNDKYRIFASGAEVELAIKTAILLNNDGISCSVISVPCLEIFDKQTTQYKQTLCGVAQKNIFIEAANLMSYYKYYNPNNDILIDITTFGLSGKDSDVAQHFGYTVESIINKIKNS